jgi:15-cis-phytoene synthase
MADPCQDLVQQWDRDRYLASLFAPDEKRPHLFALYAFDAEIARIRTLVSEPQIGEIRMQWWADTLAAIGNGNNIDQPVAAQLATTIRTFSLPTEYLSKLIDARRAELYADKFPDLFSLESYIAETDAVIMQCAAMILDHEAAAKSTITIGNYAAAFGLARLLSNESLLTKFMPEGESIESLNQLASKRLREARLGAVPKTLTAAVLPASLTELYLKSTSSPLKKQWRLWRAARSNRF